MRAPEPLDEVGGVQGKPTWALLTMAIALGPIVYVYTKQWGRLLLFSFLLLVAFFGSFIAAFVHYVREDDLQAIAAQDPTATAWLVGKLTAWVLVACGAVLLACVADVWWQCRQRAR